MVLNAKISRDICGAVFAVVFNLPPRMRISARFTNNSTLILCCLMRPLHRIICCVEKFGRVAGVKLTYTGIVPSASSQVEAPHVCQVANTERIDLWEVDIKAI